MMRGPVVIRLGLSLLVIGIIHCNANSRSAVNRRTDLNRMLEVVKRDLRQLKRENNHIKRKLHVMKTERDDFQDALAKAHRQSRELKCIAYSDVTNRESPVNLDHIISDLSANLTQAQDLFVDAEKMTRSDIAAVNASHSSMLQELVNAEKITRSDIAAVNASHSSMLQELVNAEKITRSDIAAVIAPLSSLLQELVNAEKITKSDIAAVNAPLSSMLQELVNADKITRSNITAVIAPLSSMLQELVNADKITRSNITAVIAPLSSMLQELVNAERMTRSDIAAVNASLSSMLQELVNAEKITRSDIAAVNAPLSSMLQELVNADKITRSDIAAVIAPLSSMLQEQGKTILQLVKLMNNTVMCPNEWIQYDGSCYFLSKGQKQSWTEAKERCQSHDARLVAIETQKEATFVASVVKRYGGRNPFVWIGANDIETEGQWKWTGTEEKVIVRDWSPGQPDDYKGGQDCAHISAHFHYKWDDCECDYAIDYLCEKR